MKNCLKSSKIWKNVKIVENCQNCKKKTVKIVGNCQNYQNCQKLLEKLKIVGVLHVGCFKPAAHHSGSELQVCQPWIVIRCQYKVNWWLWLKDQLLQQIVIWWLSEHEQNIKAWPSDHHDLKISRNSRWSPDDCLNIDRLSSYD